MGFRYYWCNILRLSLLFPGLQWIGKTCWGSQALRKMVYQLRVISKTHLRSVRYLLVIAIIRNVSLRSPNSICCGTPTSNTGMCLGLCLPIYPTENGMCSPPTTTFAENLNRLQSRGPLAAAQPLLRAPRVPAQLPTCYDFMDGPSGWVFMISPFSWNRIKKEKRTRISCNHNLCKHDNTNVFVFPCSLTMLEPLNEWPAVLITSAWHSRSQLGQQLSYLWFPFKILHCKSANAVTTFTTGCHSSLRTSYVFFVIFVFLWYFLYHFIPSFRLRHPATWLMIFLPVSPTMATEVPTSFSLRPLASPRRKVIL